MLEDALEDRVEARPQAKPRWVGALIRGARKSKLIIPLFVRFQGSK